MSGAGAFLQGLAGGYSTGQDIEQERLRTDMWHEWNRDQRYLPRGENDGYYAPPREQRATSSEGWSDVPSGRRRAGGPSHISTDPVAADMPRHQRAFLNAIAVGESAGAYDVRYTPRGGERFDLNGKHPRIFEPGPAGPSSAAGRYQFTATTWDRMGGGDFSPENQDRRAWALAVQDYRARTGRDLDKDLMRGGMTADMVDALAPTWAAFEGKPERFIKTYDDSFRRFTESARATSSDPYAQPQGQHPAEQGVIRDAVQALPSLAETGGRFPREQGLDPLLFINSKMGAV